MVFLCHVRIVDIDRWKGQCVKGWVIGVMEIRTRLHCGPFFYWKELYGVESQFSCNLYKRSHIYYHSEPHNTQDTTDVIDTHALHGSACTYQPSLSVGISLDADILTVLAPKERMISLEDCGALKARTEDTAATKTVNLSMYGTFRSSDIQLAKFNKLRRV